MATDYSDELMEEMGELQEELDHADAWDARLPARAGDGRAALPAAGRRRSRTLSGGERRRVALCKLLLSKPDLLLLDEPTNHLDAESVLWLEQHLAEYPGAVLAVTHDRYFLDNVAQWILEIDRGRTYPYEGNYSTYLEKKAERLAVAGPQGRQAAEAAHRGAGVGALRRQGPADQEPGPPAALRGDGRPRPRRPASSTSRRSRSRRARGWATSWSRSSTCDKGFDDRVLIEDLSFSLPRNGIVGVIGPNGVGKTTLFKTIVGLEEPDAGDGPGRRDGQAVLRRPEPRRARPEEDGVGGRLRRARPHQGRPGRDAVAGLRRGVRVQGPGPAEAGRACSPAASATGSTWR